ncbi:glycerol-3-phosphate responsive antiterminator [Ancrocorticia populi]|uniref:Glycerol-3-phosphate responsive antiterminator n=1 Tax=Ancrocorticia populi TaxID=2175228 RepID=A0A2V1KC34_9ACTO|nr:glycerol-3-phosphate responsive antiterminator [Ancrocorticia populi]PWF26490.1 glycerol-3-phosphate responsive antiterminator [Ancrocorticia populi]
MIEFDSPTVIPSVRKLKDLELALQGPSDFVLLSEVHIGNLEPLAARCAQAGKKVLVHADLIGGFKADRDGIKLLRNMFHVDGVLSQSAHVVSAAKKAKLLAIQRVFIMDSRSLDRSLAALGEARPDGIEVLPGALATHYYTLFDQWADQCALIAGGMVRSREEAEELFDTGYEAITASTSDLWKMSF